MTSFAIIVGVGLLLSLASPWLTRRAGGWVCAVYPAGVFVYVLQLQLSGALTEPLVASVPWIPSLGITLGIYVDGLSSVFLLVITGIGAVVLLYADAYLGDHPSKGRFYGLMLLFQVAMIGLVIAGDLIVLFLFWELTSVSSYLLIGFNHERESARRAALHAILVTGIGGLALLAGFLVMGDAAGGFGLSGLLEAEGSLQGHPLYLAMLLLVLAGAFTKSAQVPFHFWLPGAMEAPTPVSAYLHSATMVKAGVYLLARLTPALGGTDEWHLIVTTVGAVTMLFGALVGYFQNDLKAILAYTTVSALGTLVMLLGLNTSPAATAAIVFLVVHSLYKGSLFLVTGSIDHETGTRDLESLGGLRAVLPLTGAAAVLAAVSMAGLPPMLGYISKELLYEAKLQAPSLAPLITGSGVFANFMIAATAAMIAIRAFFGRPARDLAGVHETPATMWVGPLVLAGAGFAIALFPERFGEVIIDPAVRAIHAELTDPEIPEWNGMSPVFLLSILTILLGLLLFLAHRPVRAMMAGVRVPVPLRPAEAFESMLSLMKTAAARMTSLLQSGYLRRYVGAVIWTVVVLVGLALVRSGFSVAIPAVDIRPYELAVVLAMAAAAVAAVLSRSRMAAILALGMVGTGVALIFAFFSAPDLAMTQMAVETLIVVIFVLIVHRLPIFSDYSSLRTRLRDAFVAGVAGAFMALLTLVMALGHGSESISEWFGQNSLVLANGRNVVNVILVDFRALDTLGEITVLAIAALGVAALLRPGRPSTADRGGEEAQP